MDADVRVIIGNDAADVEVKITVESEDDNGNDDLEVVTDDYAKVPCQPIPP